MLKLSEEQQRALDSHTEDPFELVDPRTNVVYVLMHRDAYRAAKGFLRSFGRVWNDPEPDVYEEYRKKP